MNASVESAGGKHCTSNFDTRSDEKTDQTSGVPRDWYVARPAIAPATDANVALGIGLAASPAAKTPETVVCLRSSTRIEQAVNAGLESVLRDAKALLRARFSEISVADLARDLDKRSNETFR